MTYATDAFYRRWSSHAEGGRTLLVKATLTSPTARTIYLSSRDVGKMPDGNVYEPLISTTTPIEAPCLLLDSGPNLATCSFTLAAAKLGYLDVATDTVHATLNDYEWQGASVTMWLWLTEPNLPAFTDALEAFSGIITGYRGTREGLTFTCKQDTAWNNDLPDKLITEANYPGVPKGLIASGAYAPVVFGSREAEPLRPPYAPYTWKDWHEDAGGATQVSPGILVNSGRVGGEIEVLFAGHKLHGFATLPGVRTFLRGGDALSVLVTTGLTITNTDAEAKIAVANGGMRAIAGIMPTDARIESTADNPLNAIDILRPESYAYLDSVAGKGLLQLVLPNVGSLGSRQAAWVYVAYTTTASSLIMVARNYADDTSMFTPDIALPYTGADLAMEPVIHFTGVGVTNGFNSYPASDWSWGGDGGATMRDIRFAFLNNVSANKARIYWVAIVSYYSPSQSVLALGPKHQDKSKAPDVQGRKKTSDAKEMQFGYWSRDPSTQSFDGDFFANLRGWPDDALGTYTGVPNALIERPSDIATLVLNHYGAVPLASIEQGASVFGSLVLARDNTTLDGQAVKVGATFTNAGMVEDVLKSLATDTRSFWFINRFTGKHSWRQWGPVTTIATYPRVLAREDVLQGMFAFERPSEAFIANHVGVGYGVDAYRSRDLHRTMVSGATSVGDNEARDQALQVILGVNDTLDYTDDSGTYVGVLAPGNYTVSSLSAEVRDALGYANKRVDYGAVVVADYNDRLPIHTAGLTDFELLLTPGDYKTMEALAAEAQRALRTESGFSAFTVTYDGATALFTFAANGGPTFSLPFAYYDDGLFATHPARYTCAVLFGFDPGPTSTGTYPSLVSSLTSTFPRLADAFVIGSRTSPFSLNWLTGPTAAKSCAALLGYSGAANSSGAVVYPAPQSRGARESIAAASIAAHGKKPQLSLEGIWLQRSTEAVDLRNVQFDIRSTPRLRLNVGTYRFPDLCRTMSFLTDASIDAFAALPGVGATGTWESKLWIAGGIRQHIGPTNWHTEVEAIEAVTEAGSAGSAYVPPAVGAQVYFQNIVGTTHTASFLSRGSARVFQSIVGTVHAAATESNSGAIATPDDAFVVWRDDRNTSTNVNSYIQRVRIDGTRLWTTDGVKLGNSVNNTTLTGECDTCSDMGGGAFAAFLDKRTGVSQLYVTHLDSAGAVQSPWPAQGQQWTSDAGDKYHARVLSDGAGGFVVYWVHSSGTKIYAQRVNADGTFPAGWATPIAIFDQVGMAGFALGSSTYHAPMMSRDAGGLWILYPVNAGSTQRVLVQRILWDGTIPAGYDANFGVQITSQSSSGCAPRGLVPNGSGSAHLIYSIGINVQHRKISGAGVFETSQITLTGPGTRIDDAYVSEGCCSDGAGGVITTWEDSRSGPTYQMMGQRVLNNGTLAWTAGGTPFGPSRGTGSLASKSRAMAGRTGGAVVVWRQNTTASNYELRLQYLDAATGAPQWAGGGTGFTLLTPTTGDFTDPFITSDGSGGAYIGWSGPSGSGSDIHLQRIDESGAVLWAANGVAVCAATAQQRTCRGAGVKVTS